MTVADIRSRNIVRAPRSASLREGALLMRRHHVGALLVTDAAAGEERVVGIVTDRDLVLQATAAGIGPDDGTLGEVMSSDLATIAADAPWHDAVEEMRRQGVRRLGVTVGDELIGLVSFDDVIDAIAARVAGSAKDPNDLAMAAELEALAGILRTEREREQSRNGTPPFAA